MSPYPVTIRRCQHIKVNGIQCGSPAKRDEMHCFFHDQCRFISSQPKMKFVDRDTIKLPNLEDANSIQLALAEVMRLILTYQIDDRIASLLLRALRAAAANVRFTSLEPKPTRIVIDPKCVENRPLGATAWSTVEGQEFDMVADPNDGDNKDEEEPDSEKEERDSMADLDDPDNPEALEYRAFGLRVTAAMRADPANIRLSSEEIYSLNPTKMSQICYYPDPLCKYSDHQLPSNEQQNPSEQPSSNQSEKSPSNP